MTKNRQHFTWRILSECKRGHCTDEARNCISYLHDVIFGDDVQQQFRYDGLGRLIETRAYTSGVLDSKTQLLVNAAGKAIRENQTDLSAGVTKVVDNYWSGVTAAIVGQRVSAEKSGTIPSGESRLAESCEYSALYDAKGNVITLLKRAVSASVWSIAQKFLYTATGALDISCDLSSGLEWRYLSGFRYNTSTNRNSFLAWTGGGFYDQANARMMVADNSGYVSGAVAAIDAASRTSNWTNMLSGQGNWTFKGLGQEMLVGGLNAMAAMGEGLSDDGLSTSQSLVPILGSGMTGMNKLAQGDFGAAMANFALAALDLVGAGAVLKMGAKAAAIEAMRLSAYAAGGFAAGTGVGLMLGMSWRESMMVGGAGAMMGTAFGPAALRGIGNLGREAAPMRGMPGTRADLHIDLRSKGFTLQGTSKNGYVTYKAPTGKTVTIKPSGEVIRTQRVPKSTGQGKYSERQDYFGNRLPDQSHSTGHFVEPIQDTNVGYLFGG